MSAENIPHYQVRRVPARGHYDDETIHGILDDGFLCHAGFVADGQPFVIPTLYGRDQDRVYLHGARASRLMRHLASGMPVCLSVAHLDALVLARSMFHHSVNYRSAVLFGRGIPVEGEEQLEGLRVISEQVIPGRWQEARLPSEKELAATAVVRFTIEHASAKVRTGPPVDEPSDRASGVWAGLVPLLIQCGFPIADPDLEAGIAVPASVHALNSPE